MEARDPEDDKGGMDKDRVSPGKFRTIYVEPTRRPESTGQEAPPTTKESARKSGNMAHLAEEMARVGICDEPEEENTQEAGRLLAEQLTRDAQEVQNIREAARISAAWLHQNQPATGPRGIEEAYEDYARLQKAAEGVPVETDLPAKVTASSDNTVPSEVYIPPNVHVPPGVKIPPGSKFPTNVPLVFPSGMNFPPDQPIGLAEDCLNEWCDRVAPHLKGLSFWGAPQTELTTDPAEKGQHAETDNPFLKLPQTPPKHKSERAPEFINTCNDDAATAKLDFMQYSPGQKLCLNPHEPPGPYGISHYKNPDGMSSKDKMLSKAEEQMSRTELVFRYTPYVPSAEKNNDWSVALPTDSTHSDKKKGKQKVTPKSDKPFKGFQVEVKIVRLINGGSEAGCQILLCEATAVPKSKTWTTSLKNKDEASLYGEPLNVGDQVVVKVFDPLFYGDVSNTDKGPWKVTSIADGDLSRENAAYRHLWEAGRTGSPHLAPQYHGSWTLPLGTDYPKFKGQTRRVGAIMIEYIQGKSIEDLCYRNKHYHLVPPTGPTYLDFEKTKQLDLTREVRLKTLKNFMKHTVHQLHAGVEHWWPEPENILISTDKDGKPRVVLIDYVSSMIDSKRKEPYGLFKDYIKPPHPYGQFSIEKLTHFAGWFPPGWRSEHLDTWVLRRFHSLENRDYTNPWTHERGTMYEPDSDSDTDSAGMSKQKSDTLLDVPLGKAKKLMGSVRRVRSSFKLTQEKDDDGGSGDASGAMH